MKRNIILFILILISVSYEGNSQELPPINNFTPLDYNAGNQNWAIAQAADKVIYAANNDGLLVFNGAFWKLYPSPNGTIMRSVLVSSEKVYTGCYMEFGFWQENKFGNLVYTSLSKKLSLNLLEDEEFWNILEVDEFIIFQSLSRIYIYDKRNNSVVVIESTEVIKKMYQVDGAVYFQRTNKGIYQIENGKDILLLDDSEIRNKEVINIFKVDSELIFLTRDKGFYSYGNGILKEWRKEINASLLNYSIYSATQLSNVNFALGTISNGLIYLNIDKGILYTINQSKGILNNTVLALFQDFDENIWMALDNGISYVNTKSPIQIFRDVRGLLGSVYASAIWNNRLYLGTNQGLFYKTIDDKEVPFQLIEGTQGQVWSLKIIEEELFCGHDKGTFIIDGSNAVLIADIAGTWSFKMLEDRKDIMIQGNYDGLYIIEKQANQWQLRNKIKGFNYSARSFEVLNNQIFVNHEYRGLFHLLVDDSFTKVETLEIDTLLKGANSSITKYDGQILYTYDQGIFKYNKAAAIFERDSLLSVIYSEQEYISGQVLPIEDGAKAWIFTRSKMSLISGNNLTEKPKIEMIPIPLEIRRDVIDYENIISIDGQKQYLFGTSDGYITLDVGKIFVDNFMIYLGPVQVGVNEEISRPAFFVQKDSEVQLENDENNLIFNAYSPEYYKYFRTTYQFRLNGIYDNWSKWGNDSKIELNNLPPGDYELNVRSRVGDTLSANVASFKFSIAPPWYRSSIMLFTYIVAIILFSLVLHNIYTAYYRKQREKIISQKNKELALSRLQNEKEIVNIKNEQLELDYKSKSKELAASTMSIVKRNELLTQIKSKLVELDDEKKLAPVIKILDKNLSHNQNWELFTEAFNNADSDFFQRMKSLHPELSPNDLKLCAYLRLNMSSKEIAPLFNISPSSVEIKRYRLRKKMDLDNSKNLTDYILSI